MKALFSKTEAGEKQPGSLNLLSPDLSKDAIRAVGLIFTKQLSFS